MDRAPRFLAVLLATLTSIALNSSAVVIWSDDFTGQTDGTFPTRDFNTNTVNDWAATSTATMFTVNTSLGNPAPGMAFDDSVGGAQGVMRLEMDEFAAFSTADAGTTELRVSFDWKVESFLSGATNEAFRVILRANNSQATGSQVVIGFNRANLDDGDASSADLTFYAAAPTNGSSNFTPTNATAIGLSPGAGWLPGFDFGEYAGGDTASNDTDDLFYRFTLTYDYVTGALNGSATRIATDATNGQTASFTLALSPGLEFTNTDLGDVLLIASTNSATGLSRFDNFLFESIPEPTVVATASLAAGVLLAGGRRLVRNPAARL